MSGEERELEDGGHAVHRSWCAACVESRGRCAVDNIFKLNRWMKRKENEQCHRWVSFDCGFSDTGKRRFQF